MNGKQLNRYSIVELIDIIKNEADKAISENAQSELDSRDLTDVQLKKSNTDYELFKKFQLERKDKSLTKEEWFSFFFLSVLTPKSRWRTNDHFTESEFERFEKYGYDRKGKEAEEAKFIGKIFWVLLIIVIILSFRLYRN